MKRFSRSSSRAFSLVEVVLALGIVAFCLVTLMGLLPVGVNSNQMSITQTAAASAASSVMADLRATSKTMTSSPLFALPIPAGGDPAATHTVFLREDGSIAAASGKNADQNADPSQNPYFRATVYFVPPAKDKNQRNATVARLVVSWPALTDPNAAQVPTKFSGAFEAVTALDRN